ncbi:hypothetical protein BD310DRAFT_911450 [Dichomitus squalens]|uniref:F-box domain-containing protein n=1 Tax=Dichomitus squalens TaxID=114155 RepID=A0A4Q9QCM1_9APHY|nr:hypothetical protein BD310DRAFT_911450 [Dichomitus squalens]
MIRLTDFPDDILEEIFHAMRSLMCFPGERHSEPLYPHDHDDDGEDYRNVYGPRRRPVPLWANVIALSHVCTHWRRLMLTRPRLWTFLRVTGSFANRMMINEMLERTGGFPISVLFTHPFHTDSEPDGDPSAVYDLLALASVIGDCSERIQELGIVLDTSEQVALVLDTLGRCPVPMLDKLWLDSADANSGSGFAAARTSLLDHAMPPLRVLHARNISVPWLPYERLVRLELACGPAPPLAALLHTLRASPQLELLALRTATPKADLRRPPHALADEPRAFLPRLRRLQLHVGPLFDAAFSVLPHIAFAPRTTAVTLRFDGRVSSPLYEDCGSLEALAGAVRRAAFVLHRPTLASFSSLPPSPYSDADADAEPFAPLTVLWRLSEDEGRSPRARRPRRVPRLCEGLKAVPLPALTELSVALVPFYDADAREPAERDDVARLRRLWESVRTVRRLEVGVHPAHARRVFAALGARAREVPLGEAGEGQGIGEEGGEEEEELEEEEGEEEEDSWGEGAEGEIVCPALRSLRVNWWTRPGVDELWCVERCCLARASAGARLECLETVEFPEIVLASLRHHVDRIEVL